MTPDLTDLGRRAVACDGWRWMPGMRTLSGPDLRTWRLRDHGGYPEPVLLESGPKLPRAGWGPTELPPPDLSDPATLGCLLALVREKHGDHVEMNKIPFAGSNLHWAVNNFNSDWPVVAFGYGETHAIARAAALVAALEAPC